MGFRYLWPLALLILIPIIVIMYLLKQKTEPHPFSSLFLWRETYKNLQSEKPFDKLKRSLLMIMQILTVLALVVALMSPYVRSKSSHAGHVILVIDNSAGMKTRYDDRHTRLDVAIDNAASVIDSLSEGTTISIIAANKDAVLLLSDSADKSLALKRLKSIEPTNYAGSCNSAVSMVRSMAIQWNSCEVIYFTDSAVTGGFSDATGYIVDVGKYVENAYVEYVGHGVGTDGTLTVLAKITNNTDSTLTCEVNLYGDDKIIAVSDPLNIPAKNSDIIYFEKLNYTGSSVCVELNNVRDALPDDDRCYDIITEAKDCNALLLTAQNRYLETAIKLIDGIRLTKCADAEDFRVATATEKYELYIFDGIVPKNLPEDGNMIFINAFDGNICVLDEVLSGVNVKVTPSKLTGYLENYKFGVSVANTIKCPSWADPFLVTTAKDSTYTVGCFGTLNGRNICMLGFDFHNSELPLLIQFPILIKNIMNECAGTGMLQTTVISTGAAISVNGSSSASALTVTKPNGKAETLAQQGFTYTDTALTGIYTVSQTVNSEKLTERFAVNFPKNESTLTAKVSESSEGDAVTVEGTVANTTLNLRNHIIIFILLLLAAEWVVYIKSN